MVDVVPIRARRDRYFDVSLLTEYSEGEVREAIASLSASDVAQERGCLITRLVPKLALVAPLIMWTEADVSCEQCSQGLWNCTIVAPMADPKYTCWSVEWPAVEDEACDYAPDADEGVFVVRQKIVAHSEAGARDRFSALLDAFQMNLVKVSAEIERYNAALPYLLSLWAEVRLDGFPVDYEGLSSSIFAIKKELYGKVLEDLVAEGELAFLEEIDPKTGKLRRRYFHPDHRPKAN